MLAATLFGWGSDADDTDAVIEEQMAAYERQIEKSQEAMPVPTWDGYGGLVKVSEEHLAQQVQELTQRHLAARQAAGAAAKGAGGELPRLASPFAAEPGVKPNGGALGPLLPPPLHATLDRAGAALDRDDRDAAAVELRTMLAGVPLHASEALEAVVDVVFDRWPGEGTSPAGGSPLSTAPRPHLGTARQELQQALAFLRRKEPRRALAVLRSAQEALQGCQKGPDAFCVQLLEDFICSKRHV